MKIASWNINSLRVRLPHVVDWLNTARPDILAVQETKLQDENFPVEEIEAVGYQVIYSGQKTYNGVAILSRSIATDVIKGIPALEDEQRRVLSASYDKLRIINVYVPNGQSIDSDKYRYKLDWLKKLTHYVQAELKKYPRLIVLGDFNIAPEERDVHDPAEWKGSVLFSDAERQAFRDLLACGLCDTFRLFEQDEKQYSWWDYRMGAFRRNRGLRIDHVLASETLCTHCIASDIDRGPRAWERPSDHAPIIAEFKD